MTTRGYQFSRLVTPATDSGLITLEQAKLVLGIEDTDTSQDVIVQAQIDAVSAGICNYCDRAFVVQTYRDQFAYPCLGFDDPLRSRQYPIPVDTAGVPTLFTVTVDGNVIDPTLYDLDAENGRAYLINGVWAGAKIVLDYTAGFNPIPPDVQAATNEWLTSRWLSRGRDPAVQSEALFEVATVTYSDAGGAAGSGEGGGPPPGVCNWLVPYRMWFV
jgi:hypothetical protein